MITQCVVNIGLMLGKASLCCNSSQAPVLILRQASGARLLHIIYVYYNESSAHEAGAAAYMHK